MPDTDDRASDHEHEPEHEHRINPDTGLPQTSPQAAWPERVEAGSMAISYAITVNANADELWRLLADPHRHHEVDGSGTVKPKVTGPHQLSVGDEFSVHMVMYRVPYVMKLVTTAAEPGRLIEWKHPGGHRWRWEFETLDNDTNDAETTPRTRVTETFDYRRVKPVVARGYRLLRRTNENDKGIRSSLTRLAGRYL
ncbi:MAG: SRPBCC family protein [Micrococcaceae bacterium]